MNKNKRIRRLKTPRKNAPVILAKADGVPHAKRANSQSFTMHCFYIVYLCVLAENPSNKFNALLNLSRILNRCILIHCAAI